jgi:hypothetical protein
VDVHAIGFGYGTDVKSSSYGTCDRSLLLVVRKAFASKIGASSLRYLNDDRRFDVSDSRFQLMTSEEKKGRD